MKPKDKRPARCAYCGCLLRSGNKNAYCLPCERSIMGPVRLFARFCSVNSHAFNNIKINPVSARVRDGVLTWSGTVVSRGRRARVVDQRIGRNGLPLPGAANKVFQALRCDT